MTIVLDSDRALEDECKDQFGFVAMAQRLAPAVAEASKGEGMVIGLEGRWGSGKTSLLNFLRSELHVAQKDGVQTITIAPWLNGDTSPLVLSLLEPMAALLKQREEEIAGAGDDKGNATKEKMAEVGRLLRDYGPKTVRRAASFANVAGYFLPGAHVAGNMFTDAANAAEQMLSSGPTPSDMKHELAHKIQELDIGFVVILDDLDRLEPEQAVEVIRLVRSVADFPKVVYLMCYDREVLAQALEVGLKVADGDLFLQKIVQLTFNIPLPEPFDLRALFFNEAKSIYSEAMSKDLEGELLDDLKSAVDREGMDLSTPREVKLALNSIRFVFLPVKDDVYFPDFCRLQLIKVTNYRLYRWIEAYLAVRSVLVTGDANVSKEERKELGEELKTLLPSEGLGSVRSISSLGRFIPGLFDAEKPDERVFNRVGPSEVSEAMKLRRLGSPLHYRFYFALTGPKTVMPEKEFNTLLELARDDIEKLTHALIQNTKRRRQSGRTWFGHVLDRLDDQCISTLDEDQLAGMLKALSEMMDVAMNEDGGARSFFLSLDRTANEVAKTCLARLCELNPSRQAEVVQYMASEGKAINWLVGKFFRSQLFRHGKVGEEPESPEQWEIPDPILDDAIDSLKKRVGRQDTKKLIPSLPDISAYLYGWLNITGDDQAKAWVREYSESDEGFLEILNHMRGWAMSDKVYYPLKKDTVSRFLDWQDVEKRLEKMEGGEYSDRVSELQLAIKQSRD